MKCLKVACMNRDPPATSKVWSTNLGPVQTGTGSGNRQNSLSTTLSSRKWREISILPSVLSVW